MAGSGRNAPRKKGNPSKNPVNPFKAVKEGLGAMGANYRAAGRAITPKRRSTEEAKGGKSSKNSSPAPAKKKYTGRQEKIDAAADRAEARGAAPYPKRPKAATSNSEAPAKKKAPMAAKPKPKAARKPPGTAGKSGLKAWAAKERAGIAKQRAAKKSTEPKKAPKRAKKKGSSHKKAFGSFYSGN